MTTWISHLRIAENLLPHLGNIDVPYFTMGNVGPDSGVLNEAKDGYEPPPAITHFQQPDGMLPRFADLTFYRENLQHIKSYDSKIYAFRLGYFFHLIVDNLWTNQVWRPAQKRWSAAFEADPQFVWELKRDWYGIDFEYVRSRPESLYWRGFLGCEYEVDCVDFVPAFGIQQTVERIQILYQRTDEEIEDWYIQRPRKYLTTAEMDDFVQSSTSILLNVYHNMEQLADCPENMLSALDCLSK